MGTQGEAGREFWRGVLVAGGSTTIPEWTLEPVAGIAEHTETVPQRLLSALGERADEVGVPLRAVLLAAHATVLAALSGEKDVVTGYLAVDAAGGAAVSLPCRLSTEAPSWRALLVLAHRVESMLLEHREFPVAALREELSLVGPSSQVEFGGAAGAELAAGAVLRVGFEPAGEGLTLRLRYRTEVIDAGCAARIAGYHRRALELIEADLDADHGRQSLLSEQELDFQIEGLAGPRRDLGDKRFHELFEERVARHPDAVAGVHGDREWTYRELNARANRLGRALLARGCNREDVVAVVTERNLDWMASVIAIFKAGGAYLPIEPHFPSDRIATTLRRSECRFVLTERESTTTLDPALATLPALERLYVDEAYEQGRHDGDDQGGLGIQVTDDQLAYIYFTSGSTGQPKGAMCEQAGMLNHLWAKIGDLGLGEGEVMAEIAPQCFDISLWQLVAALLQGGRTLIVEQDVILDVTRFIDKIVTGRVNVMQVVPSYLEVVCAYLEQHPRELPDLHCVSTTGEALKKELTQRWFSLQPGIKIGNAYGLTETSDDVTHEVMDRVPDRDRVPLGPAVINTHIYVVDEHLAPVPLGAPGEIIFSGVCVGRGYINDPERTAAAFMDDPLRPGERIYRSGDHGRWLPEGKLEFLGRRDTQVKIRGFRIEIGEIDNALLRVPGVRDGAVVVAERADASKHLVGFYAGPAELDVAVIQDKLAESLPEYMVPGVFHRRERLPLTANGKIDTKALTALAGELEAASAGAYDAPATPTEIRLAAAFAKVLEIPVEQVSRSDDFFDRGSSLSAVKLAVALERKVSLKEITRNPVLSDLAALLDSKLGGGAQTAAASAQRGLLQPLSPPASAPGHAPSALLVCFPYAGGNAVNFQPLARALKDSGLAVYAVELPGHDLVAESSASGTSIDAESSGSGTSIESEKEPFVPTGQVVDQVTAEIGALLGSTGLKTVLLWGHSAGTAAALEAARRLTERGVTVGRVFLGAQLLGDVDARRARIADLAGRTNAEIVAGLSGDSGYTGLAELDAQRAEHVGAAYRHDYVSANTYFADALENPPTVKLAAPVTVVIAADDPSTASYRERYGDWGLLADKVELHEISQGGHYFLRTRPDEAARAVLGATELLTSS